MCTVSKREVTTKVSVADLPAALARVVSDLGLVDENGRVNREHVRTLGEFVVRFVPAAQPPPAERPVSRVGDVDSPAGEVATPTGRPRRGRPPRDTASRAGTVGTRPRTRPTKAEVRGELTRRIAEHLRQCPGSTLAEIADALGAPLTDVSVSAKPVDWLVLEESDLAEPPMRTESEAIAATRERAKAALAAASLLAGPLSHQAYTTLVREGRVRGPSVARIVQLFGSWTAACAEVGVASGEPLRKNYERRWTREEILDHVERFLAEPAHRGASHQFDAWRAAVNGDGSVPSLGTVRNLVGGTWSEIRTTALRRMRARWAA